MGGLAVSMDSAAKRKDEPINGLLVLKRMCEGKFRAKADACARKKRGRTVEQQNILTRLGPVIFQQILLPSSNNQRRWLRDRDATRLWITVQTFDDWQSQR